MQLGQRLKIIRELLEEFQHTLPSPHPACVLFFSVCDQKKQATVYHVSGDSFEETWIKGLNRLPLILKRNALKAVWLRVDLVQHVTMIPWATFTKEIWAYRRNYVRYGLTLDSAFTFPLLEQECNANSILYGFNKKERSEFNKEQFAAYTKKRFGKTPDIPDVNKGTIGLFSTIGAFCDQDGRAYLLPGPDDAEYLPDRPHAKADAGPDMGLYSGRRWLHEFSDDIVDTAISTGSHFLAGEMKENGQFIYGYVAGFAKRLTAYNHVRHAGTLFSLLYTMEYNHDETLRPIVDAGIHALASMIKTYSTQDGQEIGHLLEPNGDIKLGGDGLALVALSQWTKFTGQNDYLPLINKIAAGIAQLQQEDGTFLHVLNGDDLSVKSAYRTVYYDGEALFGLMQAYGVTKEQRWLTVAEKAFDAFIKLEHWKHQDHWLSYAANEITLYKPEDKFFQFGIRNISNHIKFIQNRETTYPTLLELSMAAEKMLRRLEDMPEKQHLLEGININAFRQAAKCRAEYLLNGYFWPEVAMYFSRPLRFEGSFYIRHHAFRVRIDDIGHYLCGLVGYASLFSKKQ